MQFLTDPRRRSVALLGLGVFLFLALLGVLQAFNIRILNPVSAGETLVFTSLIVVVFILLMVLLMLLLRNILKLYADQSSSALGARLRTRMVLGATLIALTPAVFMFLFSFLLMNRSIDRWFSSPTTELREDFHADPRGLRHQLRHVLIHVHRLPDGPAIAAFEKPQRGQHRGQSAHPGEPVYRAAGRVDQYLRHRSGLPHRLLAELAGVGAAGHPRIHGDDRDLPGNQGDAGGAVVPGVVLDFDSKSRSETDEFDMEARDDVIKHGTDGEGSLFGLIPHREGAYRLLDFSA